MARRNKAIEGKMSGGSAPYGMAKDGKESLKPGDPKQVKTIRWMFEQVGNELRSMNWIVRDLNGRNVPGPAGEKWSVKGVRAVLRRRCYRGDFTFNVDHTGQFYGIDEKGEVVEASDLNGKRKVFLKEGVYKPVVDPKLFDKVQKRLDLLSRDRGQRKRQYALSGILKCGHCGGPLCGVRQKDQPTAYRCSSPAKKGTYCGIRQVREDLILPFMMKMLGQEVKAILEHDARIPDELSPAGKRKRAEGKRDEKERLSEQVKKIEDKLFHDLVDMSPSTFKAMESRLLAAKKELETVEAELVREEPRPDRLTDEERDALQKWWAGLVRIPLPGLTEEQAAEYYGMTVKEYRAQDLLSDPRSAELDPRKVNDLLRELGAWCKLWWRTEPGKTGKKSRHFLVKGEFKLGQFQGKIPHYFLGTSAPR